ncbi:MAG: hypothetical protein IJ087_22020, partial [Eggerthellaceae bacterium]|nr:hypothetical protein [Eggerthellaceae bacterium]
MKIAGHYLVAAAGCALFALVYAQFSHGVYSPFMTFMFALPLVGGTFVALVCHLAKAHVTRRTSRQAWALSLASHTLGSCLQGILALAAPGSPFVVP